MTIARSGRGALAVVVAQRLGELAWSRRNEGRLARRGGVESDSGHHPAMVALHSGWIVATAWEASRGGRARPGALAAYALLQPLRYWVIRTLGDRWTTRIVVVPGEAPVTSGPYRWVEHPNYLVVAAELVVLPLGVGAPRTAAVTSVLNAALMAIRIPAERRALDAAVAART
ncbi:isoprenylcysteine carboxyl methyltransferase family protein [Ilumatobacter sp.]|uniref:isoprenylcysteine carboxyl methyltransferase family protein n=1 Tax=Ilumatobacter sp. TaxID=1967498 RepID=UPI003B521CDC